MYKVFSIAITLFIGTNLISQTLSSGINLSYIDSSVSPKNDIYKFANGKWLSTKKIPASDGAWGSFNEIDERNTANLKSLMSIVSKDTKALLGSNNQKLRDFYITAIDSAKIDKAGLNPISADLAAIDLIKTIDDVIKTSALLNKKAVGGIIGFYVTSDYKSSNTNAIMMIFQGQIT